MNHDDHRVGAGRDPWADPDEAAASPIGPEMAAPVTVAVSGTLDPGTRLCVVGDEVVVVGRDAGRGTVVAVDLHGEVTPLPLDTVTAAGGRLVVGTAGGATVVVALAPTGPRLEAEWEVTLDDPDARPDVVGGTDRLLLPGPGTLTVVTVGSGGCATETEVDLGGEVVTAAGRWGGDADGTGGAVAIAAQVGHPSVLEVVIVTPGGVAARTTVPETRPVAPSIGWVGGDVLVVWVTERGDEVWGLRFDRDLHVLDGPERLIGEERGRRRIQAPKLATSSHGAVLAWRVLDRSGHGDIDHLIARVSPGLEVGAPRALLPAGGAFADLTSAGRGAVALHGGAPHLSTFPDPPE